MLAAVPNMHLWTRKNYFWKSSVSGSRRFDNLESSTVAYPPTPDITFSFDRWRYVTWMRAS